MSSDFDSFDQDSADGFIQSTLDARSWPETGTIWAATGVAVYKLFSSDFSIDFSNALAADAIGGTDRRVWASERQLNFPSPDRTITYELDPDDLSSIRSVNQVLLDIRGIGGSNNVIWAGRTVFLLLAEISLVDFSVVRSESTGVISLLGVGGMGDVIWGVTTNLGGQIREFNELNLSVQRAAAAPSGGPKGVGGSSNVIWYSQSLSTHELDPTDLSSVRSEVTLTFADIGGQ